ncbi:MAG: TaqI-like C-terminal specificity domain-containing protein [Bacteroidia bacterium]
MKPLSIPPRKALNKAYIKFKPSREAIEDFKGHLRTLIDSLRGKETEEGHKNNLATFLRDAFYKQNHHLNAKGDIDLAIYTGKTSKEPVGVVVEMKHPDNASEMFSESSLTAKSMCELLLYYFRERIEDSNKDLRHLVITNGWDWYIFDAITFDRAFFSKGSLRKDYTDWKEGRKSGSTTQFFYDHVAKPFLLRSEEDLPYVHIDLRGYGKALQGADPRGDEKVSLLYKLLSPAHLLKEPFATDSNSLNKDFYAELLHIIGLEEAKDKNKKVIRRAEEGRRLNGSLLENAIERLDIEGTLGNLSNRRAFGETATEQAFAVGLELCITWVNRILFLKLLEAQLRSYHRGDADYRFLNHRSIRDFDELYNLFFMVLARRPSERKDRVRDRYRLVPYLNSSLFERTALEQAAFSINEIDNHITLPVHSRTVLKEANGKRLSGELNTLEYLLRFLDAYDFSSDGGEEIQEENKTLINASVLGLIFEKINGYRDGSFFTPGFITMYMCRETLRRAVVNRFNAQYGWAVQDFEGLQDKLEEDKDKRREYNALINGMRICDPAVGSGHFLVSALNELLCIKADLGILCYRDGKRVREYSLQVANDELVIFDVEEGKPFAYTLGKSGQAITERQALQEALFHEKQTLIESCLFGVDINPNSVKICRLRLWIELLKHAYYTSESSYTELETLPNIDINIKQGNSLISRFGLQDDLSAALRDSGHSIEEYRQAVQDYRHASGSTEKRTVLDMIDRIKGAFRDTIDKPLMQRIAKARGLLATKEEDILNLRKFGMPVGAKLQQEHDRAKADLESALAEKREIEDSAIFRDAFEWRFEFPEVLNADGDFVGFDVVIANPPYIRQEEIKEFKAHFGQRFKTFVSSADLYVYFVELGMGLGRSGGEFCYIIPNKWMRASYGELLRDWLRQWNLQGIIDFGDLPVFDEATTYPCILSIRNAASEGQLLAASIPNLDFDDLGSLVSSIAYTVDMDTLGSDGWTLLQADVAAVLAKIKAQGVPLGEYVGGKIYYGIKTGLNEAFVIDRARRDRLITEDARSAEVIKPFLAGRDVKRWRVNDSGNYLILIPNGWTTLNKIDELEPWTYLEYRYPAIARHLAPHEAAAKKRSDKGQYWWELRACDYYKEFEKVKVFYPDISYKTNFSLDREGFFAANTTYFFTVPEDVALVILGILNSNLITNYYASISASVRGGYLRFFTQYVQTLPIMLPDLFTDRTAIEKIVNKIIVIKSEQPQAETSELESEINQLVYALYGLTAEEIAVLEGSVSQ